MKPQTTIAKITLGTILLIAIPCLVALCFTEMELKPSISACAGGVAVFITLITYTNWIADTAEPDPEEA